MLNGNKFLKLDKILNLGICQIVFKIMKLIIKKILKQPFSVKYQCNKFFAATENT